MLSAKLKKNVKFCFSTVPKQQHFNFLCLSSGSPIFLSATQISTWWTPRDPNLKQHMDKIMIVWMIFSSKLLSSFSVSASYFFLKYLRYRPTKTSSFIYNPGMWIAATHFLTLRVPCLSCHPYFGNHCLSRYGLDWTPGFLHIPLELVQFEDVLLLDTWVRQPGGRWTHAARQERLNGRPQ